MGSRFTKAGRELRIRILAALGFAADREAQEGDDEQDPEDFPWIKTQHVAVASGVSSGSITVLLHSLVDDGCAEVGHASGHSKQLQWRATGKTLPEHYTVRYAEHTASGKPQLDHRALTAAFKNFPATKKTAPEL